MEKRCTQGNARGKFLKIILIFMCALLWTRGLSAKETARLVFIGDIMTHAEQLEAAKRLDSWDFTPQFRRIKPLLDDAFVVGNFETVMAGEKARYTGYPTFNTPDALAAALKDAGVDAVTLATNHILDRHEAGAERTMRVLDEAGILYVGLRNGDAGYEPLVTEYAGFKLAFLNYSYGSNMPASKVLSPDIRLNVISSDAVSKGLRAARAVLPDILIACFHWGNEYQFNPTASSKDTAELCFENGADILIGTHPHVFQPVEIFKTDDRTKLAAWSLGNFVSNQRTLPRERSAILAVDIEKDGASTDIKRVSVAPIWVSSRRNGGKRLFEIVYAGTGGKFNHYGLPASELKKARAAGKKVLDFLGAQDEPDEDGFYTLWDAASPDILPKGTLKSPK
ncbi:MAG: CapA family protein [Synergistaceae bacterium]|jgi:poly-gamma-glutamate synthesis protein (capsule biosynthesis protein)|nr:CapA family protein [Synergistaceae bacterium]